MLYEASYHIFLPNLYGFLVFLLGFHFHFDVGHLIVCYRFPKVILNHPVLLSPRGRNQLRAWTFSRAFDVENQKDIRSYFGELFKRASIRFGADPNLDWKEGLKNALGENYYDWIMYLEDYEFYNKNDPLDFLECNAKIVENVIPRLGLTPEEVDGVLTGAYPLFLCFLWETMNVVQEVKFKGFYGYLGSVFKWKSKRLGKDLRNLDWKHGLKKALGEKYNDWIVHLEDYDKYLKDDPMSFLVCSQKIVTHVKTKLGLIEDEVDIVLSKAYPDFLVVLFETMFLTTEMPGESLAEEWERWDGY